MDGYFHLSTMNENKSNDWKRKKNVGMEKKKIKDTIVFWFTTYWTSRVNW